MASFHDLPRRDDFRSTGITYLDCAYSHPIGFAARRALDEYLEFRMAGDPTDGYDFLGVRSQVIRNFAGLIGAEAHEIAIVPSTMAAENMVLAALRLDRGKGRVITDSLHFLGSLYLYERLAAKGLEVEVIPVRDGRIALEDYENALRTPADLVALSLVSNYNGFRHDLDAICALAKAEGVPVYADVIQAAGAIPFDVRTSGVDFCGCASYKWLMGDFGAGFIYARAGILPKLEGSGHGYRQVDDLIAYPEEQPPVRWLKRGDAIGQFGLGTMANGIVAQLSASLPYLREIGVERLADHRDRLLARLRSGLDRRGIPMLTPLGGQTPILAVAIADAADTRARLKAAGVFATVYHNRLRVAPSLFNDEADIDRLLAALE